MVRDINESMTNLMSNNRNQVSRIALQVVVCWRP